MATTFTLLASPDYVKQATPMGRSIDDDLLSPCILNAQERHILPSLGTNLYEALIKKIQAGNVTGAYLALLENYVQPCLVQYSFSEVIPHLRTALSHNSATTAAGEQASPASSEDIRGLINRADNLGAFHKERMLDYLQANSTSFAEFTSNTFPNLSPRRRNYTQGLNLDPTYESEMLKIARQLLGVTT